MRLQVGVTLGRTGPGRVLQQHLPAEFVGDSKALGGPQPSDALAPILVLRRADASPVASNKCLDAPRNHPCILHRGSPEGFNVQPSEQLAPRVEDRGVQCLEPHERRQPAAAVPDRNR